MKQLEGLKEEDLVFYDIETAAAVEVLDPESQLYEAWKYKARYNNELNRKTGATFTIEEYFYEKAPLYAPFGRVVAVVVGRIKENKIVLKTYASEDEKQLLNDFNKDLEKVFKSNRNTKLVGFNSVGYDTPFLEKRSIVNGVRPSSLISEGHLEPWKVTQIDLSKIWKGNAFYPDSLVAVATALGLPSPKDALDGSMVSQAFYEGKLSLIADYCKKDVETTVRVYRKLAFLSDLEPGFTEVASEPEPISLPENILETIVLKKDLDAEDIEIIKSKTTKATKKEKTIIVDIVQSLAIQEQEFLDSGIVPADSKAVREFKTSQAKTIYEKD